jgi:enamine deaminase RidA (YjgF/YER057c/UK114 family)
MTVLQPPGWKRPSGYANGVAAAGTMVFVAGQIGWNARSEFETDDLVGSPTSPRSLPKRARSPSTSRG